MGYQIIIVKIPTDVEMTDGRYLFKFLCDFG